MRDEQNGGTVAAAIVTFNIVNIHIVYIKVQIWSNACLYESIMHVYLILMIYASCERRISSFMAHLKSQENTSQVTTTKRNARITTLIYIYILY